MMRRYAAGAGLALATAVLLTWTTIVRDDGSGAGFFLIIMALGVGGFAAEFRAKGMARTMLGVAVMQAMFGLAVATAPITAAAPGGIARALAFNGCFVVLWLMSAALFGRTAAPPRRCS